jgi:hypothetical protein
MDQLQLGPASSYAKPMVSASIILLVYVATAYVFRALSFHVFGAACVLLNEQPEDSEGTSDDAWKTEIQMALHVLDGVASRNMVASQAAIAIRTKLEDSTAVV